MEQGGHNRHNKGIIFLCFQKSNDFSSMCKARLRQNLSLKRAFSLETVTVIYDMKFAMSLQFSGAYSNVLAHILEKNVFIRRRGERGTVCHGAHSVSGVFSITIHFRYVVAIQNMFVFVCNGPVTIKNNSTPATRFVKIWKSLFLQRKRNFVKENKMLACEETR